MKIAAIDTLACSAGWRNYHFVKLTTDTGIVGWSEFSEGFGSPGVSNVIEAMAPHLIGMSVDAHEKAFALMIAKSRTAMGGVVGQGLGAIENALLDAKAKGLGVPAYSLLGGKVRDRIRVYWSHCVTWRVMHPDHYPPRIVTLDDVKALGAEVREKGFGALKTNIFDFSNGPARNWRPGFGVPFAPDLNIERDMLHDLRANLEALRDGAGPKMDILLDLNFNGRTEGMLQILRTIAGLDILWVEIDTYNAKAMRYLREHSHHPISGCETLIGLREFIPYFEAQAMDVPIIDAVWNGAWQSMKIAAMAEAYEMSIAPHNFYGHLSTMMNVHFAAAVPNLRIMETDIDRIAHDDELFTYVPEISDGHVLVPDTPGWGTEPDEEALRRHPPDLSRRLTA